VSQSMGHTDDIMESARYAGLYNSTRVPNHHSDAPFHRLLVEKHINHLVAHPKIHGYIKSYFAYSSILERVEPVWIVASRSQKTQRYRLASILHDWLYNTPPLLRYPMHSFVRALLSSLLSNRPRRMRVEQRIRDVILAEVLLGLGPTCLHSHRIKDLGNNMFEPYLSSRFGEKTQCPLSLLTITAE
jgi:hypothetical protein